MKKFRSLFAIILALSLLLTLTIVTTSAEGPTEVSDEAGLKAALGNDNVRSIILTSDITINAIIYIENSNVTLDLAGKSIKSIVPDSPALVCDTDSNMTINDSVGGGKIWTEASNSSLFGFSDSSSLTINAGTFESTKGFIVNQMEGGNLTINGGSFTSKFSIIEAYGGTITINGSDTSFNSRDTIVACSRENELNLTINDGSFYADDNVLDIYGGNVEINGGKFENATEDDYQGSGQSPCVNITNEYNDNTENAVVKFNGGKFISHNAQTLNIDISDDYNAMEVIIDGASFEFVSDKTLPSMYGGMNANSAAAIALRNGKLTIENSDIKANANMIYGISQLGGTLTINSSTVLSKCNSAVNYRLGTLIINGGTYDGMVGLSVSSSSPNVTLKGGVFRASQTLPDALIPLFSAITPDVDEYLDALGGIVGVEGTDILPFLGDGYSLYSNDGKDADAVFQKSITVKNGSKTTTINNTISSKTVVVEKTNAALSDGKEAKIDVSKATDTLFKSDMDFKWFDSVKVDGKTIDPSNYTAVSGSTDVTLKASYLKTLSNGKHTLQIVSNILGNKVVAETTFTVTGALEEEEEKIANTGDNNMIGAFVALSLFSACGYVTLKKKEN